jgi:hypothetical protein
MPTGEVDALFRFQVIFAGFSARPLSSVATFGLQSLTPKVFRISILMFCSAIANRYAIAIAKDGTELAFYR